MSPLLAGVMILAFLHLTFSTGDPILTARNPSPTFGIELETVTLRVVFLVVRGTSSGGGEGPGKGGDTLPSIIKKSFEKLQKYEIQGKTENKNSPYSVILGNRKASRLTPYCKESLDGLENASGI